MFGFVEKKFHERKRKLLSGFTPTAVEKSMTAEEFDERYSAGYDVFDIHGLSAYEKDVLEKGGTKEEVLTEFNKLERVVITKGEVSTILFVKKIEE